MNYQETLDSLEEQLTNENLSFEEKMELKDKILDLKYKSGIKAKPKDSPFDCVGCSA